MNIIALHAYKKPLLVAIVIAFFMLLTRGSHALTQVSLPDASLVLFLLGGLLLGSDIFTLVFTPFCTGLLYSLSSLQMFYLSESFP